MPRIVTGSSRIEYSERGPLRGPLLVFAPGLLLPSQCWDAQVEALSKSFRCVTFDFRGHGSSRGRGHCDMSDLTDELDAVLQETAKKPVHFIGHSLGAYAVLPLASRAPERFASLSLVSASISAEEPHVAHNFLSLAKHWGRKGIAGQEERLINTYFSPESLNAETGEEIVSLWLESVQQAPHKETREVIKAVANRYGMPVEASTIRVPTQIITGTEDVLNPVDRAERIHRIIPDSRMHLIPQVGHALPWEAPAELSSLIRAFIWELSHQAEGQ